MKNLKNSKGVIALITMLVLMGVGILGTAMVVTSQMNTSASNNYSNKIQTFCAADGLMTLLAEDIFDYMDTNYLQKRPNAFIGTVSPSTANPYGYRYDSLTSSATADTLRAGGAFSLGTTDNFLYSYCQMNGTIELITSVSSLKAGTSGGNKGNKAGIMIRQSLSANSPYVMTLFYDGVTDSARMESRDTVSKASLKRPGGVTAVLPAWLKLNKTGSIFQASYSTDGITWSPIGCDTMAMTDPVYIGLALGSGTSADRDTVVFKNTSGIPINIRIDSATVGTVPVKYNIYQLSSDVFTISTEGYKTKGTAATHNYVTKLNQSIARQHASSWRTSAKGTALVPVTVYDMRSNMSNPEFNVYGADPSGKCAHMVRTDTLTSDRKPIKRNLTPADTTFRRAFMNCFASNWYTTTAALRCANANGNGNQATALATPGTSVYFPWCFNDSIHTWFRPWGDSSGKSGTYTYDYMSGKWSGLKMRPGWTPHYVGEDTEWVTQHWDRDSSKQPFANIIMYDTLVFNQKPNDTSMFRFGDTVFNPKWFLTGQIGPPTFGTCRAWTYIKFMPPNRRGFGYDCANRFAVDMCDSAAWNKQNFAFTMEFHRLFTYKPGQTFNFQGDDDVWVFINNRCVIDLGGVHGQLSQLICLDSFASPTKCNLTAGKKYLFDFFYCERCLNTSDIIINTNMDFFVPPQPPKRSWKRDYGNLD